MLSREEIEEIRTLGVGAWHVIGHHIPKIFTDLTSTRDRLDELYASTKQMVCPRCSVQMDYPADTAEPCFACPRLRAAVRAEAEARGEKR